MPDYLHGNLIKNAFNFRGKYSLNFEWSSERNVCDLALQLWHQSLIQEIMASEQPLKDNEVFAYYLDNIDTILDENYIPSQRDILSMRIPTTETTTTELKTQNVSIFLIDVGTLHCHLL